VEKLRHYSLFSKAQTNARKRQITGVQWVDFFLFPRMKSIMKGARFAGVAAIQERLTAVLRSIPEEVFADSFQKFYELCQQCVVKVLKSNKFNLFVSSVLFVYWYNSPNVLDTPGNVKYNKKLNVNG
jgi:hypothetical protein